MDSIIEEKIIELITEATIEDVSENVVVNIADELKDWNEPADYPAIVVSSYGWVAGNQQIGAIEKKYTVYIAVLVMKETKKEAKLQRSIILNRVDSVLRRNQQLTGLSDNTGRERAFSMNVAEVRFAHAGFAGQVQAVANFRVTVDTNLTGPF